VVSVAKEAKPGINGNTHKAVLIYTNEPLRAMVTYEVFH
jgi:hypothetical protein